MNFVKYNRSFVMMDEQSRDFVTKDAPVKGYLKVETGNNKGALRCVVQNLKYFPRGEYIYKLIFFGKKNGRAIHYVFGSLIVNYSGSGETYFRFSPLNVDGKGNSYDDFSVAIVAAASGTNDKEALHPVLKGMIRNEPAAVRQDEGSSDGQVGSTAQEYSEKRRDEDYRTEEVLQSDSDDEPVQEKTAASHEEKFIEKLKKETDELKKKEKKPRAVFNSYYNDYLLQFCTYTCKVAGYYEEVMPFENDRTGARWKKIQNVANLPLVSPGAHFFATQYKHYLFGAKPDANGLAEEYFFAVPGRFIQEEQPDGGRSGFVCWQPVAGAPEAQSSYGYWIVAVDARTGDILEVANQN